MVILLLEYNNGRIIFKEECGFTQKSMAISELEVSN